MTLPADRAEDIVAATEAVMTSENRDATSFAAAWSLGPPA